MIADAGRGDTRVGLGSICGAGLQASTGGQSVRDMPQIIPYIPFFFWIAVLRIWRRACLRAAQYTWVRPFPHFSSTRPRHPCYTTMPPSDAAMPPANADLATTWAYLEEGIDQIMNHLREGGSTGSIPSGYL